MRAHPVKTTIDAPHAARRSRWRRTGFIAAIALVLLGAGCETTVKTDRSYDQRDPEQIRSLYDRDEPLNKPAGRSRSVHLRAAILPKGAVPYVNMALPVVDPQGRYVATETGAPPRWDTVLARPGQHVPAATAIEIHRLPDKQGRTERLAVVEQPAMLGRAANSNGFLIEAPQENGARWIGFVPWSGSATDWLVQDEHVNAFACLGPDNRLAWSRRTTDGQHFELVVRHHNKQFTIRAEQTQWLLPVWSGRGDGLFVFALRDGSLDVVYASAQSEAAFRQSMRRLNVARGASVHTAYQSLHTTQITITDQPARYEHLAFVHPSEMRMAVWRPFAPTNERLTLLEQNSFAAIVDINADLTLTATSQNLLVERFTSPTDDSELIGNTLIPRRVRRDDWPYLLLSPQERAVALTAMRLLPSEQ